MTSASDKIRTFLQNPVESLKELHREYGINQREFSKILFITSAALLMVSMHVSTTLGTVQQDLERTEKEVQQASAVITSEDFQDAMDTLQRIRSERLSGQIQTAVNSFESARKSFDRISASADKVSQTRYMYQWLSLISILGLVSSTALRFM